MKNNFLFIIFLFSANLLMAQDTTKQATKPANESFFDNDNVSTQTKSNAVSGKIKNEDQVLPRKAIDVTYRFGKLFYNTEMVGLASSYNGIGDTLGTPKLNTKKARMQSINLQFCYFLGKNRRWGISTGLNWFRQQGSLSIDKYKVQYQSKDSNGDIFRQVLSNEGAIKEDFVSSSLVVPVMLKYKHQFRNNSTYGKNIGFTVDGGLLLGLNSSIQYNGSGTFNYEAIYKYATDTKNNPVTIYDNVYDPSHNRPYSEESQIITESFWNTNNTSDNDYESYCQQKRNEGLNVGNHKNASSDTKTKYSVTPSFGFLIQPSLTYAINYNLTFMLGAYYSLQTFKNKNNSEYLLTKTYGKYNSMFDGMKRNTVTSYGLNIGVRFFFGEHKDTDGDGFYDYGKNKDICPTQFGLSFGGCPDSDGDGTPDSQDDCINTPGGKDTHGCPDRDGDNIIDDEDACPDLAGDPSTNSKQNGCPFSEQAEALGYVKRDEMVTTTAPKDAEEEYFDVLQKDFINFNFGQSTILPSNFMVLDNAVKILSERPELVLYISGHTDSIGSKERNMELSSDRAESVSNYMQSKGIKENRIIAKGYGAKKPLSENTDENGRAKNRRTEMKLLIPIKPRK